MNRCGIVTKSAHVEYYVHKHYQMKVFSISIHLGPLKRQNTIRFKKFNKNQNSKVDIYFYRWFIFSYIVQLKYFKTNMSQKTHLISN